MTEKFWEQVNSKQFYTLLSLTHIAKSDHPCLILCNGEKDLTFRDATYQTAQLFWCLIRVHVAFDEGRIVNIAIGDSPSLHRNNMNCLSVITDEITNFDIHPIR